MAFSLRDPSHTLSLVRASSCAPTARMPRSHARAQGRAMVLFLVSTLVIWLFARITLL